MNPDLPLLSRFDSKIKQKWYTCIIFQYTWVISSEGDGDPCSRLNFSMDMRSRHFRERIQSPIISSVYTVRRRLEGWYHSGPLIQPDLLSSSISRRSPSGSSTRSDFLWLSIVLARTLWSGLEDLMAEWRRSWTNVSLCQQQRSPIYQRQIR